MGINTSSESNIHTVEKIHRSLTDFYYFISTLRGNSAGNIAGVIQLPARITKLLQDKSVFDAKGISATEVKEIMQDQFNYLNWDDQIADFTAVFNKVATLRTTVINNIDRLMPSYNGDTLEFTAGAAQTALENQLDDVLQHFD